MHELEIVDDKLIKEVNNAIEEIVNIYRDHSFFWQNASGWAPDEANEILVKSRLDWLHSLAEALYIWIETYRTSSNNDGKLILAWVNLGSLLEGGLKLFLSVHFLDYKRSSNCIKDRSGNIKNPDILQMEELKVFIQKENIFEKRWIKFISLIQVRRNAIHAYKDREIGSWKEYFDSVKTLRDFTKVIKKTLPYPYWGSL